MARTIRLINRFNSFTTCNDHTSYKIQVKEGNITKAKEFLQTYDIWEDRLSAIDAKLDRLYAMAYRTTSTLTDMPKAPDAEYSKVEDAAVQIADLVNDRAECKWHMDEVDNAISAVMIPVYMDLLRWRYIEGKDWHDIAEDMHVDVRTAQEMHGRALRCIKGKENGGA